MHPLSDTIVAPATPAGVAALGIVRMSGPAALVVADVMFRCAGRPLSRRRPWSAVYGHVHEPGSDEVVDEVVAVVFREPRSYTGQDMVEFTCHGNPLILAQVVQAARQAGARDAAPGEFTYRAYMSGRLDLMQCEAVADLIGSQSREAIRAARRQQRGILSHRISELRSSLLEAQAGLEYAVDFPDDDPDDGIGAATEAVRRVKDELETLRVSALRSVSLRDCATVAIVGRPNVGKSSLLNALAGRRRSIVTARPGTTRDVVEQTVDLGGATIMLQDTAGVRLPRDDAERAGVDLATEAASCADLILLVLDARQGCTRQDQQIAAALDASRTVWVWNKTDLVDGDRKARLLARSRGLGATGDVVAISATGGAGVAELADLIGRRAVSHASRQSPALTNARHVDLLNKAARLLEDALDDSVLDDQPEIAAIALQEATAALEELVGRTTPDDVIARVFARFCVGK